MKHKFWLLLLGLTVILSVQLVSTQHENIPYQPVADICQTCLCLSSQDNDRRVHQTLNCAMKNFEHILARWPPEFGTQHAGMEIVVTYSGNNIPLLQQLPATNATLTLSCRHCNMKQLQAPLFMDVPNVERLYLSWNQLSSDALQSELFRGPFKATKYEPIGLIDLDLSHNRIATLERNLFEHTPQLSKLNLAYNQLSVLDSSTTMALASVTSLQRLDLSHNALTTLPAKLFAALERLRILDLSGNALLVMPVAVHQLSGSLEHLNLAGNPFGSFNSQSFQSLHALRRLNISAMPNLRSIDNGTFADLHNLEQLDCARNTKLQQLDFNSLRGSRNLTQLDLSYNSLTTLSLSLNTSTNVSASLVLWPRLRSFQLQFNPWYCSCELMQILESVSTAASQLAQGSARCDTPYLLAGTKLSNLTANQICNMVIPKKYRVVEDDPPRFLRRRYVILTAIIASFVIVLGLIIGFIIVCVRRRLKGDDYGIQPIRYTSVRGSNLSALSQLPRPVSLTSKFQTSAHTTTSGATNA